jgi:hypothetical protein
VKGRHSREIKLKKLKHKEGHIELGKWNSQWSHIQSYVGWALLFCFCNLLARVYKGRPFCSQGSAFGHESAESVSAQCFFLLNCLSVLYLSHLQIPTTFLEGLSGISETVICHLLCCQGFVLWTIRRRSHQEPMDSLIQRRDSSSQRFGVMASHAQWNLVRCRKQWGEGSTACQTGKIPGSNSGLAQEAGGEIDHFPEATSNCLLGWNYVSQVQKKV